MLWFKASTFWLSVDGFGDDQQGSGFFAAVFVAPEADVSGCRQGVTEHLVLLDWGKDRSSVADGSRILGPAGTSPPIDTESSNETSNGRSVIDGYPQVRLVTSILQNPTSKVLSWYSLVLAETAFAELGDPSRSDGDPHLADSDLKRYAPVMW